MDAQAFGNMHVITGGFELSITNAVYPKTIRCKSKMDAMGLM